MRWFEPSLLWPRAALMLLAGALQAASLAWPLIGFEALGLQQGQPVWWLQLLALALLAHRLLDCRLPNGAGDWRGAALWGGLFSTAWLAATFWWMFVAMHTYGGLAAALAALAVLLLAALLALYYAAVCGLFVCLKPINTSSSAIIFAALWLLAELARGRWLSGFGWGAVGYAHVEGPLAGFAPWLGSYGLCALAAGLAMTLAQALRAGVWRQRATPVLAAGLLLSLAQALPNGVETQASNGSLSVTLLQGNIAQDEKFETGSGVPLALAWYAEQLGHSTSALVIAPETAIPVLPQQLPPDYWAGLQQRFANGAQAALLGTPLGNYELGYTNSVLGLKPGQSVPWRYDKQHLVPFGEFIPPWFKWFTAMMNIPLGDFNRGAPNQPAFEWQGQRIAPNICYENLFSEELAPQFLNPEQAPTLFVNISNLAWFGNSLARDQHLQIARMRALEFDRAFLLATNTGATAIVDHRARVTHSLARDTRGALSGEVQGRSGITPYAWWSARWGLWPWWLLVLGLLAWAVRQSLRKSAVAAGRIGHAQAVEHP